MAYKLINHIKYNVVDENSNNTEYLPKEILATAFPSEMVSDELSVNVTIKSELASQLNNEVLAEYAESQLVNEIAKQLKNHLHLNQEINQFGDLVCKANFSVVDYNLLEEVNRKLEGND